MELKTYHRQIVSSAWSNSKAHAQLIAASSFNQKTNLSSLQILSVDLTERSKQLSVVGNAIYDSSFSCLAWDNFGEKQGHYPYGVIFGGMENGTFTLWDANFIMENNQKNIKDIFEDQRECLLFAEDPEQNAYPITCAQWNSLKNNFIAFGSTSVLLADVGKDITDPKIMSIGKKNPHEGSRVTSVAWNNEVNYIFASAGENGVIALWDIKKNDSIFQFRDSPSSTNANRNVTVAWSKSIATQIAVALDDEKKNELQIWDLRNDKGPIIVIDKGHTKGINCLDWCETDPDLILTGGRDKQILCWDYNQDEEPLSSRKVSSEIYDIKWSRKLPSIYSVIMEDKISICSLDDKNLFSYVPKWHQVPAGSSFNGNESMVVYSEANGNTLQEYKIKLKNQNDISDELSKLEKVLKKEDTSQLKKGSEAEMWNLLGLKLNNENESEIYDFLGLNKEKIIKEVEKYTGKKRQVSGNQSKKTKTKKAPAPPKYIKMSEMEAANVFGSLGNSDQPMMKNQQEDDYDSNVKYDMVPRNHNWGIGKERLIKENMLIGNYEGAIDAALKSGRTAEALIIAYSVDVNTFNSTLKTFFTETTDSFISDILKHVAFKDTEELVKKYDLEQWRQCIALIFSISSLDKRPSLLKLLAERLLEEEKEKYQNAAIFCFILAQEFEEIVKVYEEKISLTKSNTRDRKKLVTKLGTYLIAIYTFTTKNVLISAAFERILRELAFICLENNHKLLAHQIFTEYLPYSSQRHIDYLVNNTEELHHLKKNNQAPIALPFMQKKKEKKNTKKQKQEHYPTNMKPMRNYPQEQQNRPKPIKKTQLEPKEKSKIPPPPPPPQKTNIITEPEPPVEQKVPITQNKVKKGPPPPPPKKKVPEHQEQQEEETPTKKNNLRFYPHKAEEQVKVQPPPTKAQKRPLPPPKKQQIKQPIKKQPEPEPESQEQVQETRVKPKRGGGRVPPPPPPPANKMTKQQPEYERQDESDQQDQQEEDLRMTPPMRVPPPKTAKKQVVNHPPVRVPPPSHQRQTQPKEKEVEERRVPPPPPTGGNRRVPPPPKR